MTQAEPDDLRCELERHGFTSVLHVAGTIDLDTSPQLRTAFLKCLADEPDLIVIDLAAVRHVADVSLTIFPALARHAGTWPGSPVALAGARPPLVNALDRLAVCREMPRYASASAAVAQADRLATPSRLRLELPPTLGSTAQSRAMVARACASWELLHLSEIAQLIVTELVSNVIRHARTAMEVSVSLRKRYLHLAVRDSSFAPPRRGGSDEPLREQGRGLLVIEALTMGWGWSPTDQGKVVWATLRTARDGVR
jgi:anti-sigma regulatory factor (Ser/Thr protein kinase)